MQDVDVAIVGGGPAGGMAAWTLAGRCRVMLLERARLPREKLCSGVLTAKAVAQLEGAVDLDRALTGRSDRTFVACGPRGALLPHRLPLLFASRPRLDAALLEAAAGRGAAVEDGQAVTAVDPDRGVVRIAGGAALTARVVIGADGATGVCALAAHGALPRAALALEARVADPRPPADRVATLDAGLPGGYFWAFPKWDGTVAVGGGTLRVGRWPRLRAEVARWARERLGVALPPRLPGRPVPCFGVPTACRGRLLLAGDAAGLADPLLGEGIPYALWSGRLAAEHALACLQGRALLADYERVLRPLRAWQWPYRLAAPAGDGLRRALAHRAVLGPGWRWLVERVPHLPAAASAATVIPATPQSRPDGP